MGSFKKCTIRPYHLNCESVHFSLFTREQIESICVKKICTPLTFDALGYPLPGGLYDKAFGPVTEMSDPCETCGQTYSNCSGHYGFIELPLPVVNPVFHKIIGSLLKITCLNCFHVQVTGHLKYMFTLQMKLLNKGLVTEANEIESKVQELISQYESLENVPEDAIISVKEYEALGIHDGEECINNKNVETLRNQFISNFFGHMKGRKKCLHCKKSLNRIQTFKNKIFVHTGKKESASGVKQSTSQQLDPKESRRYMRELWNNEKDLIVQLIPVLGKVKCDCPVDLFYFEIILVPPPNVRPVNYLMGQIVENPQSQVYKNIIQGSMLLRAIIHVVKNDGNVSVLPVEAKEAYNMAHGDSPIVKLNNAWEFLQTNVDGLLDKEMTFGRTGQGLKQIIEKKAGVIRMHMMGKRVDFAARSVITPDPNLNIGEIGIPEEFAKRLTYPVPVTLWNVEELRKMVQNGPLVHPGAVMVEYENGNLIRINPNNLGHQKSLLKSLLTPPDMPGDFRGVKRVHRHLCNGDILLLNRQPTLHKPSIMAHTARVLKGEKTLRLHYANCKAYNADFDGDEMNAHFPQNELARSEGYTIANVSNQYLVPKDGTPLSGLIQDHVISGVKLSIRGKFFTEIDYHQLVFQALSFKTSRIKLLPPAILKPVCLWSGKQILSTVIINIIPNGKEPINLTSTSKISAKAWQVEKGRPWLAGGSEFKNPNTMTEAEVVIRKGELLAGVLDKTHYGATPYGLVHCIYELYGGACATRLLSSLGKLFMSFLQMEGFTLGVKDILVQKRADKKRRKIIKDVRKIGKQAMTAALGLPMETPEDEIVKVLEKNMTENPKFRATIDKHYKSILDSYTNDINSTCLPAGLLCKFPANNLQLMVQSGAKGSTVNTMQISCLLGQIELEGKRPPVMISGKSLPSFPAFEFAPRAGGFIEGRFMTGIQPQEFFFHCMAGREGLIDTAVKTSRSGYLQRCLVKHLEGLTVNYDLTVRDSDKTVVQFAYGEDGMDVLKVQFLNKKQLKFLEENCDAMLDKRIIKSLKNDYKKVKEHTENIRSWKEKHSNGSNSRIKSAFNFFSKAIQGELKIKNPDKIVDTGRTKMSRSIEEIWNEVDDIVRKRFYDMCRPCPDPVNSLYQPDCYYGSLNERLFDLMDDYRKGIKGDKNKKKFCDMFKFKAMQSLCDPGEPVGLLAAQSVGEPSTQMTLNTFHFAGRGEMNVTLGIPRLREILMLASKNIKTPSMEIPFLNVPDLENKAEKLRKRLTRVVVADVLEKIDVSVKLEIGTQRQHTYVLRFQFLPHHLYKANFHVKPKTVLKHMSEKFFDQMFFAIRKQAKKNSHFIVTEPEKKTRKSRNDQDENDEADEKDQEKKQADEDSSDEEPEDTEDAKTAGKYQQIHDDQEPTEVEEKELSDDEGNLNDDTIVNYEDDDEEEDLTQEQVKSAYNFVNNYVYDKKNYLWCALTFALPLTYKKVDLSTILKQVAASSVIWQVSNIKRAITYMNNDQLYLRTDGVNIMEMFKYHDLLDINRLYSNDVHKIAEMYGIEAAVKVIVREVRDVFKVYGITVDPRHLLLIADYMTTSGVFEPLSRKGMENSASPLQQISFESSLTFLRNATVGGKSDQLQSPSSCLMVGKPCRIGTGMFSLLHEDF